LSQISKLLDDLNNDLDNNLYNLDYKLYIKAANIIDSFKNKKLWEYRWYLWWYFKNKIKNIILGDKYFYLKDKLSKKEEWLKFKQSPEYHLKDISDESTTKSESQQLLNILNDYKNIIIKLQDSIFADITKPFIYNFLYKHLTVKKEKLNYIKELLYFFVAKDHYEYIKLYTFFDEYDKYQDNKKEENNNQDIQSKSKTTSCKIKGFVKPKYKIKFLVSLLSSIILLLLSYFISIWFSWGIFLYILWHFLVERNYFSDKEYIRWHTWFKFIWFVLTISYFFILLFKNNILTVDIKFPILWENVTLKNILINSKLNEYATVSIEDLSDKKWTYKEAKKAFVQNLTNPKK